LYLYFYTATVEAEVKNNIAPSSPVRIDRIFVEVGDRVSKGQKLVSMDAANLKQIKYQLDNQQIEFKRIDELYKVGGASKSEWDAAKMNLDIRETSYKNLLENTSLLSPINGVVTARNYDNGDMYSGGEHRGRYAQRCFRLSARCGKSCGLCGGTCTEDV
jgi:multidrug efflux pump subunit AcrA (membrane-fusion protein)